MEEAKWRRRFRAPRVILPEWADDAPDRLVYGSNEPGRWEVYAWDRATGARRQVTDRREGTMTGVMSADGESIWWFDDTDGDELGRWVVESFEGGSQRIAAEELGRAYDTGLATGRSLNVIGRSVDGGGSSIYVLRDGAEPKQIYHHAEESWLGGLSADEKLLVIHHTEHGDSRRPRLRAMTLDGETVAELSDGAGRGLHARGFPLVHGDDRVLVLHERQDARRPLIWWPRTGETREITLDLPGEVDASWYPDGSALLISHEHAGRSTLYRYTFSSSQLEQLETPPGVIQEAAARPDGEVWYQWSDSATAPQVRSVGGSVVLDVEGDVAPTGARYQDLWVGKIHALLAEPEGPRPHPTLLLIHGGPEAHDRDCVLAAGPGVGRPRLCRRPCQLPRVVGLWQGVAGRA